MIYTLAVLSCLFPAHSSADTIPLRQLSEGDMMMQHQGTRRRRLDRRKGRKLTGSSSISWLQSGDGGYDCLATPTNDPCEHVDGNNLLPLAPDCKQYMLCQDRKLTGMFSCTVGTVFDHLVKRCVSEELADCPCIDYDASQMAIQTRSYGNTNGITRDRTADMLYKRVEDSKTAKVHDVSSSKGAKLSETSSKSAKSSSSKSGKSSETLIPAAGSEDSVDHSSVVMPKAHKEIGDAKTAKIEDVSSAKSAKLAKTSGSKSAKPYTPKSENSEASFPSPNELPATFPGQVLFPSPNEVPAPESGKVPSPNEVPAGDPGHAADKPAKGNLSSPNTSPSNKPTETAASSPTTAPRTKSPGNGQPGTPNGAPVTISPTIEVPGGSSESVTPQPNSPTVNPVTTKPSNGAPVAPTPICLSAGNENFESGIFPVSPWTTGGDRNWTRDEGNTYEGMYSINSPDLTGSTSSSISNATVVTCESFKGGTMTLGVRASVLPPSDVFGVFIDGVKETQLIAVNAWRELIVDVPAGRHVIDFSYQYNMFSVDPMPPSPPSREGAVWIDDIVLVETESLASKSMYKIEEIFLGGTNYGEMHSGDANSPRVMGDGTSSDGGQSGWWVWLVLCTFLLCFMTALKWWITRSRNQDG